MKVDDRDVQTIRDSGFFDEAWYLTRYPDVAACEMDPITHYLWLGVLLGRDPSPKFSTRGYLQANPDVAALSMNPLLHFVKSGQFESRIVPTAESFEPWSPPRTSYVERRQGAVAVDPAVRLIAFYLPQFHPIPENNEWWGEGFTEWSNVRPAKQQFVGHYQPHVPHADIGYYDLTDVETQRKQIELAKEYGVGGFCFYYYWFAGKRLLEKPIDNYLNDPSLDHPFCLCWANENWSRRWDGLESEVLMAQDHSPQDDLGCIADLGRYIRDKRYIRIDGKPLVMIYRPSLLPSAKETAARWRKWCRENGIGEIYLAYTQSFEKVDPAEIGFDAAIEFPPNNSGPPDITGNVVPLDSEYRGKAYDWDVFLERSANYEKPEFKLFRGVNPGWDNTARRKAGGTVFLNSTPEKYETWLKRAVADTVQRFESPSERLVFVNAWNEWAEGAHLEPDTKHGYAYLEATRRALTAEGDAADVTGSGSPRKVLIVSHDAYRHGAQYLALHLARVCKEDFGYEVHMLVLGEGPLIEDFAEHATVHSLAGIDPAGEQAAALARKLRAEGIDLAICNTAVSGRVMPTLAGAGFKMVSLIHELPEVIRQYSLESTCETIAKLAETVVFPAPIVASGFAEFAPESAHKQAINPQGLFKLNPLGRNDASRNEARARLRRKFNLAADAPIILGAGYADKRKGVDLYVEAGVKLLKRCPEVRFIWLGTDAEPEWMEYAKSAAVEAGVLDRFIFPGFDEDTDTYFAGSDVFALPSREDPFPSVALYALDCGLPIVAFAGTGGMNDVIEQCGGINAPAFHIDALADAFERAAFDENLRAVARAKGPAMVDRKYLFRRYVHDLLAFDTNPIPRVSVIVPNYNYEHYIGMRLDSVRDQTVPVYELIVLDDMSSDGSIAEIRRVIEHYSIPTQLHVNEQNSGSVFKQWQKGVEMAKGDLVWIAEADDLADPEFLEELCKPFADPNVVLSYCQSRMIDGLGRVVADNYLDYVSDISTDRWTRAYVAKDLDEVASALFVKNVIPNVSAVVFRRDAIHEVLRKHGDEILSYRNAGDWVAYIRIHELGAIAFNPKSLNAHRRHQSSVTIGNSNQRHFDEIVKVQTDTIRRYNLGPAAEAKAKAYAEKVAAHFGLENV